MVESTQQDHNRGNMDKSEKISIRLFITGRHPAKLFDQADQAFDLVPFLVQVLVILTRPRPILLGWDHHLGALTFDHLDQAVAVVTLVGDPRREALAFDQGLRVRNVRLLTTTQQESCRVAQTVGRDVDLGGKSAP